MTAGTMPAAAFPAGVQQAIVAHYERVAPMWVTSFDAIPLVVGYTPAGLGGPTAYAGELHHAVPPSIHTTAVTSEHGRHLYLACTANAVVWLAHRYAMSFYSWSPLAADPTRAAFGRILLRIEGSATQTMLAEALLALRALLFASGLEAVPVLNGVDGAALWLPYSNAPEYERLRGRLTAFAEDAAAKHPALLVCGPKPKATDRIVIECASNAIGRFSGLPYSLANAPALPMQTPIDWSELAGIENGDVTATTSAARFAAAGDVFARAVEAIGPQEFR